MTTAPPVNGRVQSYLDGLDRIQGVLDKTQQQITSGVRVSLASDDPTAVPSILKTQASIDADEQVRTNLNQAKVELQAGDSALQQAAKLLDQAISLGTQGASDIASTQYEAILQQARALQQSLVGIASTSVNDRYIFSGDRDTEPLYAIDPTQPSGVKQIAPAESTLRVVDRDGGEVWRPRTAAEIFDHGTAAEGGIFAAVAGLVSALSSHNTAAAAAAVANLKVAGEHLGGQLGIFGIAENRVADAISTSANATVSEKQALSSLRDTDVPMAALALSQAGLQQQAALSIGGKLSQKTLFDYLA